MNTTELNTALAIAVDGDVECLDGYAGHVRRLVVEPESRRVTDLIVEHGLLRHRVVVPMTHVKRAGDRVTHLDIGKHQLAAFAPYVAVDFARPDPAWTARHGAVPDDAAGDRRAYLPWGAPPVAESANVIVRRHLHTGVAEYEVALGPGTRVVGASGLVGHLDRVLLDPLTYTIRALVVRAGHIRTSEVEVPAGWITTIAEGKIHVDTE